MTCSSSRCPFCSHSLVCSKNNSYFVVFSLYPSKSSSKYFSGGIVLVHVPKVGLKYFKIHLQFTSLMMYSFFYIDMFRITSVILNICLQCMLSFCSLS